ncbi:hypothetical protein [Methylomarinum vadi]|uniref:hypothetical protein n=1 Tax=Methylomarinum vadi TaxID=438855 RepID=UPI001268F439|nr:hypothetical protein [Methylomarinum vadi]
MDDMKGILDAVNEHYRNQSSRIDETVELFINEVKNFRDDSTTAEHRLEESRKWLKRQLLGSYAGNAKIRDLMLRIIKRIEQGLLAE